MTVNKKKPKKPENNELLKEWFINLTELRISMAELSKEGYTEVSLYDLLTYLRGLATRKTT